MRFPNFFKKSRREVNRENQSHGKDDEDQVRRKYEFNGYKVKRTGRGRDFKAERRDLLTDKKDTKCVEVKTGNSKLSKLQKQKRRQHGHKYVEERLERTPLGLVPTESRHGTQKPRRKNNNYGFGSGLNDMFGTGSSSRQKNSSNSRGLGF